MLITFVTQRQPKELYYFLEEIVYTIVGKGIVSFLVNGRSILV